MSSTRRNIQAKRRRARRERVWQQSRDPYFIVVDGVGFIVARHIPREEAEQTARALLEAFPPVGPAVGVISGDKSKSWLGDRQLDRKDFTEGLE